MGLKTNSLGLFLTSMVVALAAKKAGEANTNVLPCYHLINISLVFQGDSDKLTDEIQQLNKSLIDTKTVALDAKKESAFLRSENLELKERMASNYFSLNDIHIAVKHFASQLNRQPKKKVSS